MMGTSETVMQYSMLIAYPVSFIPPLLYASAKSRRNEFFEKGYALDSNNYGHKGGLKMGLIVSVATIAAALVCEPLSAMLPEMPVTCSRKDFLERQYMLQQVYITLINQVIHQ
jgi:hypothetical protein